MRYILWVSALLMACDVIQDGCQYGHYLEFYPKLEIIQKGQKFNILMLDTKYDLLKLFAAFVNNLCFFT